MPNGPAGWEHWLPVLYTLLLWWLSTGVILYLDGLPQRTFRWSFLGATAVLVASWLGLAATSSDTSASGAFVAFTCGLGVWAWNETAFLLGYVTGPRQQPCDQGCGGWSHFWHAIETILHHELTIAASALAVLALTWSAPNQLGLWTFLVLWWMRVSTKLNVFLGVPNLSEEFLPEHLRYLRHFFTRRPMNLLFPASVTVGTLVTAWLVGRAADPAAGAAGAVGYTFLATLMGLGVLEHWFLVLPLPSGRLWSWGLRSHTHDGPVDALGPPRAAGSGSDLLLYGSGEDAGAVVEQEAAEGRGDR